MRRVQPNYRGGASWGAAILLFFTCVPTWSPIQSFAQGQDAAGGKEQELLAVLRSDKPASDKALTCKLLAIHGTKASVDELAKLLTNPQLASWARIALESIPGDEAGAALRKAAESLDGLLLVGTLNSMGVRRDSAAIETLASRVTHKDPEVAAAAAVALGRVGNEGASKALLAALAQPGTTNRTAIAEGLVLCAEQQWAAGKSAEAVAIYDAVRQADVSRPRIQEATRGAILARGADGIPLLLENLRSQDRGLFFIALSTAREMKGAEVDKAIAAELGRATPERAALIVHAMVDRRETVVLDAVVRAAGEGPKPVRLAALAGLARVGDASSLPTLLSASVDGDEEVAAAAKSALAELSGSAIDARIAAELAKAEGKMLPLLIELVGRRRIAATDALVKSLDHSDKTVRAAALVALGETVDAKGLRLLVTQATSPKSAEDATVARQALKAAAVRMPDREACATELTAAYDKAKAVELKTSLLDTLAAVGGTQALTTVASAARNRDPELADVSSRLLGEWMTADAAPVLLDLVKTASGDKYQTRALRGYIRIARQFVLPEKERAEMCEKALAVARQPAEKKLVIDILKRYPHAETLRLAIQAKQSPELKDDATAAILVIAQKLGAKDPSVAEQLARAGLEKVKLEIMKAEYGAGSNQRDVTAIVRKHAGDLPLVSLPSPSYNTVFGGDPAPGTVKQLRIRYRMNGKEGEAAFAEEALIVLPMPK
jgi:HEAT repeat protein